MPYGRGQKETKRKKEPYLGLDEVARNGFSGEGDTSWYTHASKRLAREL